MSKPIHAKPSLYAHYFFQLKEIALEYGYNLVLHGSLNRDLDLIAIPWQENIKPHLEMIEKFASHIGGFILMHDADNIFSTTFHGRMHYVINVNRRSHDGSDPQYYLDISVVPSVEKA
jgi:hypothetical protein